VEDVKGTKYDFSSADGAPLGDIMLDDSFVDVKPEDGGRSVAVIIDPAANYRMTMSSFSSDVHAYQVYSLPTKSFVAVEPQFNLNDPFSKIWGDRDTGMKKLAPGESASLRVKIEISEMLR
jgi:aldose 1-epimerase